MNQLTSDKKLTSLININLPFYKLKRHNHNIFKCPESTEVAIFDHSESPRANGGSQHPNQLYGPKRNGLHIYIYILNFTIKFAFSNIILKFYMQWIYHMDCVIIYLEIINQMKIFTQRWTYTARCTCRLIVINYAIN